jgi:hypothetical protein
MSTLRIKMPGTGQKLMKKAFIYFSVAVFGTVVALGFVMAVFDAAAKEADFHDEIRKARCEKGNVSKDYCQGVYYGGNEEK